MFGKGNSENLTRFARIEAILETQGGAFERLDAADQAAAEDLVSLRNVVQEAIGNLKDRMAAVEAELGLSNRRAPDHAVLGQPADVNAPQLGEGAGRVAVGEGLGQIAVSGVGVDQFAADETTDKPDE